MMRSGRVDRQVRVVVDVLLRRRRASGPTPAGGRRGCRGRGRTAPAASMMEVASTRVACTMTGPSELGSMCRKHDRRPLDAERAARRARGRSSAGPASSRAAAGRRSGPATMRDGDDDRPLARLGVARAAIETASSSDGIDSITSTSAHDERRRPSRRTRRRWCRASARRRSPKRVAQHADDEGLPAADDEAGEDVAAAGSAPRGSPGWRARDGVRSAVAPGRAAGWQPGRAARCSGEKIASRTNSAVMAAPRRKTGLRRSRRQALAIERDAGATRPRRRRRRPALVHGHRVAERAGAVPAVLGGEVVDPLLAAVWG